MADSAAGDGQKYQGYCIKDKQKLEFVVSEYAHWSNGTPVAKGPCPLCGTILNRVLSKVKAAEVGL